MDLVTALAIVIGGLGGVATYVYLGPLADLNLQIWATFIAWAAFFHTGGGESSLVKNIPAHIWGAVMATLALLLVVNVSIVSLPVTAGIWVALTVAIMIFGAKVPALGQIPSAVYGYASTAGFALLAGKLDALSSMSIGNGPLITIVISMVIGSLLGWVSGKIAGALVK